MTSFKNTAKFFLAVALVCGALASTAPAAQADPVPYEQQAFVAQVTAFQNPQKNLVMAISLTMTTADGGRVQSGTVVTTSAYSCGNFIQTATRVLKSGNQLAGVSFSSDGVSPAPNDNRFNAKVGPSIDFFVTVEQPGYDVYILSGSYGGYSVPRPSCAKINETSGGGGKSCAVKTGAKKVGLARVGRTVKVRAPRTTGDCGRVSYTWKAGGKVVKRAKALTIKRELRGKKLVAVVMLAKARPTVLRFGRVG